MTQSNDSQVLNKIHRRKWQTIYTSALCSLETSQKPPLNAYSNISKRNKTCKLTNKLLICFINIIQFQGSSQGAYIGPLLYGCGFIHIGSIFH